MYCRSTKSTKLLLFIWQSCDISQFHHLCIGTACFCVLKVSIIFFMQINTLIFIQSKCIFFHSDCSANTSKHLTAICWLWLTLLYTLLCCLKHFDFMFCFRKISISIRIKSSSLKVYTFLLNFLFFPLQFPLHLLWVQILKKQQHYSAQIWWGCKQNVWKAF